MRRCRKFAEQRKTVAAIQAPLTIGAAMVATKFPGRYAHKWGHTQNSASTTLASPDAFNPA